MSAWLRDLQLAARALRATPPFTCLAVLLLALGIAAATTLFSIANAVLFRPFPFCRPEAPCHRRRGPTRTAIRGVLPRRRGLARRHTRLRGSLRRQLHRVGVGSS